MRSFCGPRVRRENETKKKQQVDILENTHNVHRLVVQTYTQREVDNNTVTKKNGKQYNTNDLLR